MTFHYPVRHIAIKSVKPQRAGHLPAPRPLHAEPPGELPPLRLQPGASGAPTSRYIFVWVQSIMQCSSGPLGGTVAPGDSGGDSTVSRGV